MDINNLLIKKADSDCMSYPAKGYIKKLIFNNGQSLDIKRNDIVVFVGPNNSGKSQSLSDIYMLSDKKYQTVVISDIEVEKEGSLKDLLESTSIKNDRGSYLSYSTLGGNATYSENTEEIFFKNKYFDVFRNWFVIKLDTQKRLSICYPAESIRRTDQKTNPIHYAAFDKKYRKWLADNFKRAFGIEIIPNTQFGSAIPLCLGDPVKLEDVYEDEQERQEAYADILSSFKQVQNQGDGIKSFTGILLNLMLSYYSIFLIDEPESFLHPPQARIMGQIIGRTISDDQQAFISTHSEDVINGLLEVCPNRLKIIRITRNDDKNAFSILDNQNVKSVFGDPLLKYSNIMSSLFHNTVVLCESDADCKFYSVIDSYLKQEVGQYSETLFLHCGGKHRLARTASALKSLNIDVRIISDIDILDNETVFMTLIETMGLDSSIINKDYKVLVSNLHSDKDHVLRIYTKESINRILDAKKNRELSKSEINEIKKTVEIVSKWDEIKRVGESAIPAGDATNSFKRLNQNLINSNIYLVPVGELEGFVKEVGGHGPNWVNNVLEMYPDLNSAVYIKVKDFIHSIRL